MEWQAGLRCRRFAGCQHWADASRDVAGILEAEADTEVADIKAAADIHSADVGALARRYGAETNADAMLGVGGMQAGTATANRLSREGQWGEENALAGGRLNFDVADAATDAELRKQGLQIDALGAITKIDPEKGVFGMGDEAEWNGISDPAALEYHKYMQRMLPQHAAGLLGQFGGQ